MSHYVIEFALWTLLAFIIGCVIGWVLRTLFGTGDAARPHVAELAVAAPQPVQAMAPAVPRVVELESAVTPPEALDEAAIQVARMERPKGLEEPRDGKPDDLQRIIGPKNEKILHTLGFFHFDQIAGWTVEQVAWVDDHLKFNGRIDREKWIEQAGLLASGAHEEFEKRFGAKREKET